jgi:hypothetical protein
VYEDNGTYTTFDDLPHDRIFAKLLPPARRGANPLDIVNGMHMYADATQAAVAGGWAARPVRAPRQRARVRVARHGPCVAVSVPMTRV